jgi:hypothetical protein
MISLCSFSFFETFLNCTIQLDLVMRTKWITRLTSRQNTPTIFYIWEINYSSLTDHLNLINCLVTIVINWLLITSCPTQLKGPTLNNEKPHFTQLMLYSTYLSHVHFRQKILVWSSSEAIASLNDFVITSERVSFLVSSWHYPTTKTSLLICLATTCFITWVSRKRFKTLRKFCLRKCFK